MHFGVNDDAILKANCKSYKIFIFLHQFFFAFPQCNNNIAKSENFFMEKQKNIFIFSLSNLNWCILEFNLKVFNLSTNHLLCNNREKFRVYVKIRVNITTIFFWNFLASCVSLIFLLFFLLNFFLCKIREWKFDKFFSHALSYFYTYWHYSDKNFMGRYIHC